MRLRPVEFDWKDGFGRGHDLGFIAEEVQNSVSILAEYDLDGSLSSVKYTQVAVVLTKAIQELASITGTFRSNLIAWLADAANGIANIISDTLTAREKLCVGSTCVTEDQFVAVFGNQSADQSAAAGAPHSRETTEAPVGSSASGAGEMTDTATTTTPESSMTAADGTSPVPEQPDPVNADQSVSGESVEEDGDNQEPANDNTPPSQTTDLPATGTES